MASMAYYGADGRPLSAAEFMTKLFGELPNLFKDEDQLRALWGEPDTRNRLLEGLADKGFGAEELSAISNMIAAEHSDLYDVLAYVAFARPPISRTERIDTHKSEILAGHDDKLQAFLDFVLDQYVKEGVKELDQAKLPGLLELKYHAVGTATQQLGSIARIRDAFIGFQRHLYSRRDVV